MNSKVSPSQCKKCENQYYEVINRDKEIAFCTHAIQNGFNMTRDEYTFKCNPNADWCIFERQSRSNKHIRTDNNTLL